MCLSIIDTEHGHSSDWVLLEIAHAEARYLANHSKALQIRNLEVYFSVFQSL